MSEQGLSQRPEVNAEDRQKAREAFAGRPTSLVVTREGQDALLLMFMEEQFRDERHIAALEAKLAQLEGAREIVEVEYLGDIADDGQAGWAATISLQIANGTGETEQASIDAARRDLLVLTSTPKSEEAIPTEGVREQAIRECLEAVKGEQLECHERALELGEDITSYIKGRDVEDGDIGYSLALRDAEKTILALLSQPGSAPEPETGPAAAPTSHRPNYCGDCIDSDGPCACNPDEVAPKGESVQSVEAASELLHELSSWLVAHLTSEDAIQIGETPVDCAIRIMTSRKAPKGESERDRSEFVQLLLQRQAALSAPRNEKETV